MTGPRTSSRTCDPRRDDVVGADAAGAGRLAMTTARGVADGVVSTWARPRCFWRPTLPAGHAATTVSQVAKVAWARHGARQTRAFEDTAAWLVTQCSKTAVTALLRISWRTVGTIIERVMAEIDGHVDRLNGLRRIGIDEISYKKGQRYLTVVVDHDTGRLVWVDLGRDRATINRFFDQLGEARSRQITHISADGADAIADVAAIRAPQVTLCADPFHIIAWATQCLDDVRRQVWNQARRQPGGMLLAGSRVGLRYNLARGDARKIAHARYALWKNPEDLTDHQREKLDPAIHATLDHDLSNGLVESVNTKIRL